ncbi:MAG TPA: tRNA (adenosine(37)-N6)-threonylcarbamoyltransferase complex dimerization subunit type 1 TsaB [Candidatus Dormibacteraeota bacterium]|nr:tRNA (adenosine(37)-N6)-threonylcarbamoyltransferase complex dimerization subunit type 1 TsaB [Candidatus Dormibacteraeota bacterium]
MILCIDSSGDELSVALLHPSEDAGLLPLRRWPGGWGRGAARAGGRHESAIFGLIAEVGGAAGLAPVEAVAVARGPGSYTGLRVGLAAASGIAYPRRLTIHPLDSTAVAAHRAALDHGEVLALVAAGRGRVHARVHAVAGAQRPPRGEAWLMALAGLSDDPRLAALPVAAEPALLAAAVAAGLVAAPVHPGPEALAAAAAEAVGAGEGVGYDRLRAEYGS